MKKTNKKGFTIVELVIVIAVIAILAGVLIPTFSGVIKKANESKAMQAAKNEFELYLVEHAQEIDSNMNLDIVYGEYYFEVKAGQFDATPKTVGTDFHKDGVDLSKYVKATPVKDVDYTESDATKTWKSGSALRIWTEGTGLATDAPTGTYAGTEVCYKALAADLGSKDVAIYAK